MDHNLGKPPARRNLNPLTLSRLGRRPEVAGQGRRY